MPVFCEKIKKPKPTPRENGVGSRVDEDVFSSL